MVVQQAAMSATQNQIRYAADNPGEGSAAAQADAATVPPCLGSLTMLCGLLPGLR
jgi:hypothetical protein